MITSTNSENVEKLVREMGLKPGENGLFYGKLKGFPVGFKLVESGGLGTALFQVRSPFDAAQKVSGKLSYGDEVDELIASDKVEVSLENRVVWVTIVDGVGALADGSAKRIFSIVVDVLEKADLKGESDRCHYCLKERVWDPVCIDGKVAQICPACVGQRSQKEIAVDKVGRVIPLPVKCVFTLVTGTLVWVGFWAGYDLLFDWLHTKTLHVPDLLVALVAVVVGGAIGGPIGWAVKNLRKERWALAAVVMYSLCAVAVIIGEVLYVVWLVYRELQVVSLNMALRILPKAWAASDGFYIFLKLMTGCFSMVAAETTAKKLSKPKVKL
jgi:hypothetical protein